MQSTNGSGPTAAQPLMIGGVGHRSLPDNTSELERAIARVLQQLADEALCTAGAVRLLVSVAEGADRLIIAAARDAGIPYDCVLPCAPACFAEDFGGAESIATFYQLLEDAATVIQPAFVPSSRIEGYLWASRYIIDRVDVLIAVWNGGAPNGPGGTADAVEDAAARAIPVIWIPFDPPHEPAQLRLLASGRE